MVIFESADSVTRTRLLTHSVGVAADFSKVSKFFARPHFPTLLNRAITMVFVHFSRFGLCEKIWPLQIVQSVRQNGPRATSSDPGPWRPAGGTCQVHEGT